MNGNNNSVETGTDISLDYYKELKLNYNDKYGTLVEELKNKYSTGSTLNLGPGANRNSSTNTNENFYNEKNLKKLNTIETMKKKGIISFSNIKLDNSRFEKFQRAKDQYRQRLSTSLSSSSVLRSKVTKTQKDNNFKYEKVLKDVSSLINTLEMMKTKSTFHRVTVKDSLLNSHKNFIVINQFDKFRNGIPVLQLKKEDFLKKANLLHKYKEKMNNRSKQNDIKGLEVIDYNDKKTNLLNQLERLRFNFNLEGNGIGRHSKNNNFFPTELFVVKNKKPKTPEEEEESEDEIKVDKNRQAQNTFGNKNNRQKEIILPKLNCKTLDPDIIPERLDIYKKIKIRDIIGISEIVKPPFKLK